MARPQNTLFFTLATIQTIPIPNLDQFQFKSMCVHVCVRVCVMVRAGPNNQQLLLHFISNEKSLQTFIKTRILIDITLIIIIGLRI